MLSRQLRAAAGGQQEAQPTRQLLTEAGQGGTVAPLLAGPHKLGQPAPGRRLTAQQQPSKKTDNIAL